MAKAALVTGASRGIGRGIALGLAQHGWDVVINYNSNAEAARVTDLELQALGARTLVVQANVADALARENLVQATLDAFGKIDLLVNNAGMAPRQRADILEMNEASYDEVMDTNLKGPFFLTQRVAKAMLHERERSTAANHPYQPLIINIGSISAYTSSLNRAEYCLSKAGMAMMTLLFADRLAEAGINVFEVRPGIVDTDMTNVAQAKYDKLIAAGLTPIRRWGTADDVARAIVAISEGFLPLSTGEVINVDGGFHLRRL